MWGLPQILELLGKLASVSSALAGINFAVVPQVLDNIKKYWRFYVPLLLICLQALTAYGWHHDHIALVAERHAHKADIQAYKDAQAEAKAKAAEEEKRIINESTAKANEADKSYSDLLDKYRASLLRYKATQGNSGPNSDSQPDEATQGPIGPGKSSDILISAEDADTCAVNTARLQAAHDWAIHLGDNNGETSR